MQRYSDEVAEVSCLEGYSIFVRFNDGTNGVIDMSKLVHSTSAGVFASLADPEVFAQMQVVLGAVTWPGEIDLAPDAMYEALRATGTWVLV